MTETPTPPPADLVVRGAVVLAYSEADGVHFLPDHDVVVRGGVIEAVQPTGEPVPALETIDAHGMVAMPGLINCHAHSPMVLFRGVAEDVSEERWFNEYIWPMEVNLTDDDIELGARLAAAEMISTGTTTFADHYFGMEQIARSTDESGLRALLGLTYFSSDGPAGLERGLAFAESWGGKAGGRITTALAPHAPYTVGHEDLVATALAALDHDLPVHIHASESRIQTKHSIDREGVTPIEVLHRAGLFEARLLIAHGIGIVPEDVATLAAGRVGVGSAAKGYLKHGTDTTPVRLLRAAGVPVGLATDGAASNNTVDMWETMTAFALVQKAVERDQAFLSARDVLEHATVQSARAIGRGDDLGRLEAGYRADLLLVDLSGPRTQPVHDLAATLVYSAHSDDIDTTIVDGRVLMRGRKLLTVDVPGLVAEIAPRLPRLTDRSHGRSIQDYNA
ncbi:amidohydrolase [Gryllotalpicola koreensis]|uniref:Amidohydrolase n=1 Tax=Gryllotalpicola koreensis TaxID=993086 RepID=A0ABP8A1F1_9MICO